MTVRDVIKLLQPRSWNDDILIKKWFEWPPDIFLLTSYLLKVSGSYRYSESPPKSIMWPERDWLNKSKLISKEWRKWIYDKNHKKHPLAKYITEFEESSFLNVTIDSLKDIDETNWYVIKTILEVHCIADESFKGIGVLAPEDSDESSLCLKSHYFLTITGTLSRVNKHFGIVLPKIRTPKVGLTLRSLSHYLTFHDNEVEVGWYTGPWVNSEENTLNVLIIPWPFEISAKSFKGLKNYSSTRNGKYFIYDPEFTDPNSTKDFKNQVPKIIDQIKKIQDEEAHKIHLIVLPEMALRYSEFKLLRDELQRNLEPNKIPMIITGISDIFKKEGDGSNPNYGNNRIILSGFFALRWFDIVQDKHHRWRIDDEQAKIYQIHSALPGAGEWWEAINIPKRRINFFAPNGWLTICPLICEDLARLDPVSEVIRGVGPTLITALLMDGPQMSSRWSARYATILADDPGSSVLTVTSYGLIQRSNDQRKELNPKASDSHSIALWKDEKSGRQKIESDLPSRNKLITLKAEWGIEYTIDGRIDSDITALLSLKGIHSLPVLDTANSDKVMIQPLESIEDYETSKSIVRKSIVDMTELSLSSYYCDSILEITDNNKISKTFSFASTFHLIDRSINKDELFLRINKDLVTQIQECLNTKKYVPTPNFIYSILLCSIIVRRINNLDQNNTRSRNENIVYLCERHIKETLFRMDRVSRGLLNSRKIKPSYRLYIKLFSKDLEVANDLSESARSRKIYLNESKIYLSLKELVRLQLATPISILISLHKKITRENRFNNSSEESTELINKINDLLNFPKDVIGKSYNEKIFSFNQAYEIYASIKTVELIEDIQESIDNSTVNNSKRGLLRIKDDLVKSLYDTDVIIPEQVLVILSKGPRPKSKLYILNEELSELKIRLEGIIQNDVASY